MNPVIVVVGIITLTFLILGDGVPFASAATYNCTDQKWRGEWTYQCNTYGNSCGQVWVNGAVIYSSGYVPDKYTGPISCGGGGGGSYYVDDDYDRSELFDFMFPIIIFGVVIFVGGISITAIAKAISSRPKTPKKSKPDRREPKNVGPPKVDIDKPVTHLRKPDVLPKTSPPREPKAVAKEFSDIWTDLSETKLGKYFEDVGNCIIDNGEALITTKAWLDKYKNWALNEALDISAKKGPLKGPTDGFLDPKKLFIKYDPKSELIHEADPASVGRSIAGDMIEFLVKKWAHQQQKFSINPYIHMAF